MKAICRHISATRYSDGKVGHIWLGFDSCGPFMAFDGVELTGSDAEVANNMFSTPGTDLRAEYNALHEGTWLFEAGAWIEYEGFYNRKLFKSFTKAAAWAKEAGDDYCRPEVQAIKLEDA